MSSLVLDKQRGDIIFENKKIYHNIIIKSKQNKSIDYSTQKTNNKDISFQSHDDDSNNNEIQPKDSYELNNKIKEYLKSTKHQKALQSIDDYFNQKNGFQRILNLHLLSEKDNDVENIEQYPQIKSRYGKNEIEFDKSNKTAINFYKKDEHNGQKDETHLVNNDKTNSLITLRNSNKKMTPNDTVENKKYVERSIQVDSANNTHIHLYDLRKSTLPQEKCNYYDMREMNINKIKNKTKENFFFSKREKQPSCLLGNSISKMQKYYSIPLFNDTLQNINKNKDDAKQSSLFHLNSNSTSSLFMYDYNNSNIAVNDNNNNYNINYNYSNVNIINKNNYAQMRKKNNYYKFNPYLKQPPIRNNSKKETNIRSVSTILHHREIFLNDGHTNKSQQMNYNNNKGIDFKNFLIPKSTRTLYTGSLFHAKRHLRIADVCNTKKKKQGVQINNLELGETKSQFLFSTVNIKNKNPRLAPRIFDYNA